MKINELSSNDLSVIIEALELYEKTCEVLRLDDRWGTVSYLIGEIREIREEKVKRDWKKNCPFCDAKEKDFDKECPICEAPFEEFEEGEENK